MHLKVWGWGAVLTREVPPEREAAELDALQRSWELAAVMDFLELFRGDLRLGGAGFTWAQLERALVLAPGRDGLLAELHIVRNPPSFTTPRFRTHARCAAHARAALLHGLPSGVHSWFSWVGHAVCGRQIRMCTWGGFRASADGGAGAGARRRC